MASKVSDCDCGFVDSNDPTNSIFSSFLAVNFTSVEHDHLYDLFIPATYEVNKGDAPYIRKFFAEQLEQTDEGLAFTVSPPTDDDSDHVPCAQIFSRHYKFMYGSYHARWKLTDVPGTVTAFFNYKDDESEVDIERISSWTDDTLLYTVKPQLYTDSGNPENSTYKRGSLSDTTAKDATKTFNDWDFVWTEDIIHYGVNGDYTANITTNVPHEPGRLAINQWSDGNANYSLGPPTKDSTSILSFVWLVYNQTDSDKPKCEKTNSVCTITDGVFVAGEGTNAKDAEDSSGESMIDIAPDETGAAGFKMGGQLPMPGLYLALMLFFWLRCLRLM